MPELSLKLSWEQYESLKVLAEADQIRPEDVAIRAINGYILGRQDELADRAIPILTDLDDHLLGLDEVTSLGI